VKVALGFKSHSGWAALVVIGLSDGDCQVIDRRRIELIDEGELWAKQPYHAAEDLETEEACFVVNSGIAAARRVAVTRMRAIVSQIQKLKHEIAACAVLIPTPIPDWTTDEILAVHFRMHKAEGVLFPDALCRAANVCKLRLFPVSEKEITDQAAKSIGRPTEIIAAVGRSIGPPWGKDQKNAALAAMMAL